RAVLPVNGGDLQLEFVPPPPGAGPQPATSVWIDPQGGTWYGCGSAICRLSANQVQVWGESFGVPADGWQFLIKDASGNLWARSRLRLIELPAGAGRFRSIDVAEVNPLYYGHPSLLLDRQGALLVPTNAGLSMFSGGAWTRTSHRQGLPG